MKYRGPEYQRVCETNVVSATFSHKKRILFTSVDRPREQSKKVGKSSLSHEIRIESVEAADGNSFCDGLWSWKPHCRWISARVIPTEYTLGKARGVTRRHCSDPEGEGIRSRTRSCEQAVIN